MGIHDGHRERMKKSFLEHGLSGIDDLHVLELLLFYARARGDVNPLAHALMDRFGSLSAVFDAPASELLKIPGVGENTAALIKLVPQLGGRYLISKSSAENILNTSAKAGAYLLPRFLSEQDEVVYLVCLDGKLKVLNCRLISRGSVNSAGVSARKVVEAALAAGATSVILSHNHASGFALPSREDEETTKRLREALQAVDITLTDHIIVADGDFVSMADNGFFSEE